MKIFVMTGLLVLATSVLAAETSNSKNVHRSPADDSPINFQQVHGLSHPLTKIYECIPNDPSQSFKAQIWKAVRFGEKPTVIGILVDNSKGIWSVNPMSETETSTQDQYLATDFQVTGDLSSKNCGNGSCTLNAVFFGSTPMMSSGFGDKPITMTCKSPEAIPA